MTPHFYEIFYLAWNIEPNEIISSENPENPDVEKGKLI